MLVVIPVSEGETHTAYSDSIGEYIEGQEGITLEQLENLGAANDMLGDNVAGMTPIERFRWLVEDLGYYTFSALAVVDEDKIPMLQEVAKKAFEYQSSTPYEMFNSCVIAASEKVIPFYLEGVIVVDPDY